ncbi:thioesterase family protein [Aliidiomarina celeris]|uniref:thioesterase family protein n=1 Tax=Aliidiomarina celeris TaxID=2249428 RepID=UPI000DE82A1D|nr:thioesterase family protein [Aliidiomarina celeris]
MKFHELLQAITPDTEQVLSMPSGWAQGRALFGGLSAGIAYQHGVNGVNPDQHLRAMTVSFVGPIAVGEAKLTRRILREGKNVTQVSVEIAQNGEVGLSALLTFGRSRPSTVKVTETPCSSVPSREHGIDMGKLKQVPEFARHYEYRVSVGAMPFSNNPVREFGGWMRYEQEDQPISIGLFLGLVDAWPPAVLPHLSEPAPASSLTWTIEFPEPLSAQLTTRSWWQYIAYIDHATDGYGHTQAHIWDESGNLVAISRQTITVFG